MHYVCVLTFLSHLWRIQHFLSRLLITYVTKSKNKNYLQKYKLQYPSKAGLLTFTYEKMEMDLPDLESQRYNRNFHSFWNHLNSKQKEFDKVMKILTYT